MTDKLLIDRELLPCPFCGDKPELPSGEGTQYEIECSGCGQAMASVQICDLMSAEERTAGSFTNYRYTDEFVERAKKQAIENWNTRAAPRQPEGDAHKHEAQPEVAQNTGSRSMTNKLSSQGCTGCTGVEGVAAPCETPDAVDIFAWATFDGEGSYDLRLYEDNENYRDDFRAANPALHPDWVFPLFRLSDAQHAVAELQAEIDTPRQPEGEGLEVVAWQDAENPLYTTAERRQMHRWATDGYPVVELCRLSDAQRAIAELRGECERLRMQLAACGVVALANTPESASEARQMHQDYMSASCSDVAGAVDREMTLRQQLAERDAEIMEQCRLNGMGAERELKLMTQRDKLAGLLRDARELIDHGDFREGYCMCGSGVEGHSLGDGHAPVDAGEYYAGQVRERIDAALAEVKP